MNTDLRTYYIPNNPSIPKGHIYNFYLNNNTNLDLTSILNTKTISIGNLVSSSKENLTDSASIMIPESDYTRLLELNNLSYQLSNRRTEEIQKFIEQETKTTNELTKINTERQELIKKLTRGKEVRK